MFLKVATKNLTLPLWLLLHFFVLDRAILDQVLRDHVLLAKFSSLSVEIKFYWSHAVCFCIVQQQS